MITTLNPESALFIANVNRIQQSIAGANEQVSSGLKINVASDAPDQISTLLQLRANLQQNTQVQSNLTLATTDTNAADNALSSAIQLMDTALSLASQGATATTDAAGRLTMAQQIQAIQQQMVSYSQTTVQGRFIFSGDQDNLPVYTWDASAANPVVQGIDPASTRVIQDPAGGSFPASLTAQQIFDDSDPTTGEPNQDNVFNALNTLYQALQNNDTTGITNAIPLLKSASAQLNTSEAFYGNLEDRIQNATSFANNYNVQLQTQISQTEDADITSAATELTQGNTQLQAAFEMQGQMPHSSLFNYLG
jgi:flagellar hook-associated protein 3 FlgL